MDKCFNKSICNILKNAEKEMMNCHHPYVGTEHLLLSLLKNTKVSDVCRIHHLSYNEFKKELMNIIGSATKKSEHILYTPLLKQVIDNAYNDSFNSQKELDEYILLNSLLNEEDGIAIRIITNMGIDIDNLKKELNKPKLVYELGVNLSDSVKEDIFLREKEIEEIMQILLRKSKNNPLLVGHSGVGKTAIVEQLAKRIKSGQVPKRLKNYEIVMINTSTLIAGTKYRGEFENRLNNLIKEIKNNPNIIIFIDEIHTIIKTGASDGSIDAANILKPYLARGDIKMIGATTQAEYNEYLKKDKAFLRRFAKVIINEPSLNDMEYILNKTKTNYEKYYNIKIPKQIINELIYACDKYLPNHYNPDKCLDILDTACSKKVIESYKNEESNELTKNDINEVIYKRINLKKIDDTILNEVSKDLFKSYNEQSIKNILNMIKDSKNKKYMYLSGEDRTKKITLLKDLSKKLNINTINIDCKEYNDEYSMGKILSNNYLYNAIEEHPYSFIIVDNYEETNKVIHNIVETMINNGYITNTNNEKIYLNESILFLLTKEEPSRIGF